MKTKVVLTLLAVGAATLGARAQTVETVLSTNAIFEPHSVAIDATNNFYITDGANNRIVKFVADTGTLTNLAGAKGLSGSANGLGTKARFSQPAGIVLARGGLVVADSDNQLLRFVGFDGSVTNIAGAVGVRDFVNANGGGARFNYPIGMDVDAVGNIYIADSFNNAIRKLAPNNDVTTVAAGFNHPAAVAVGDNGDLWVADTRNHVIQKIDSNNVVTLVAGGFGTAGAVDDVGTSARFDSPQGLYWAGGNTGLLVSDTGNQTVRQISYSADLGDYVVTTLAGTPTQAGFTDGLLSQAKFNSPVGLGQDQLGGFIVVDLANNALRRVQRTAALPPVSEPVIGKVDFVKDSFGDLVSVLTPVSQAVFNNDIIIAIRAESGTETFYTAGVTPLDFNDTIPEPTRLTGTTPVPYADGLHPSEVGPSLISAQPDVTIKARGFSDGRRPSARVESRFQFKTGSPIIIGDNSASFSISNITSGAVMWYTTDGSDPTDNNDLAVTNKNLAAKGPVVSGTGLSLGKLTANLTFKARAFRPSYKPSEVSVKTFYPSNSIPNQISFGFEVGEASSEFVAAVGQSFYAPITLSTLAGQTMYSLQFNVTVTNNGAAPSVAPGAVGFQSMLRQAIAGFTPPRYTSINPGMFDSSGQFQSLLFTNSTENLIGVGWLERFGYSGLFPTLKQDLISFSQAHDTLFTSTDRKVVVGAYKFQIPAAATTNDSYLINIGRPSATSDGVSADVFIDTPTNGPITAVKNVQIGQRQYIVGDVAPFRWLNAGDFGEGDLLNNDVLQVFETAVYGSAPFPPPNFNPPPSDSDIFDAMDSSNGYPLTNLLVLSAFSTNLVTVGSSVVTTNQVITSTTNGANVTISTTNYVYSTNVFIYGSTNVQTNVLVNPVLLATNDIVTLTVFLTTNTVFITNNALITTNQFVITNQFLTTNTFVVTNLADTTIITTNVFSVTNSIVTTNTYVGDMSVFTNLVSFATNDVFTTNLVLVTNTVVSTNFTTNVVVTPSPSLAADGNNALIDTIQFGDGQLNVDDVFVTFRRSLDPALKWFARSWQNGTRVAVEVPNHARTLSAQSLHKPKLTLASARSSAKLSGAAPSVQFNAGAVLGNGGQTIAVPIQAAITGDLPIRVLMLNLNVRPLNGAPEIAIPVSFVSAPGLGQPTITESSVAGNFSAAWLDNTVPGITGTSLIGTLNVTLPVNAGANASYRVEFAHASASPNGVALIPQSLPPGTLPVGGGDPNFSSLNDGIPDAWRLANFGSVTAPNAAANADPDGDGVPNWAEYQAGTNPNQAGSKLELRVDSNPVTTGVMLRWLTVAGKQYILESSPAMQGGTWTPVAPNIAGDGTEKTFTETNVTAGSRFYRVRLAP